MMGSPILGGFRYAVSDEQLGVYARMTTRQRLEWVDAARIFTLKTRTRETAIRHERLRRGLTIDGPAPLDFEF
jgi:ABC-type Na+ transport system ATPase subunit NatA